MRRVRRIGLSVVLGTAVVVLVGTPAPWIGGSDRADDGVVLAELEGGNSCAASAWFHGADLVIDAATGDVVVVRRSDTVDWNGSVAAAPGEYEGSVWVELPPPFGHVEIDSWTGTTSDRRSSGTEDYALPKALPGGVRFTIAGEHTDDHGTCVGRVMMELEGSPMSSPITWAALGGTALSGVGLVAALRPLFVRRPSTEV